MGVIRVLLAVIVAGLLAGCVPSPAALGVAPQEWQQYNSQKQAQLRKNYQDIQQTQAEFGRQASHSGAQLEIKVFGGKVKMPPTWEERGYSPVTFTVSDGNCTQAVLHQLDGDEQTELGVCYGNGMLYLDPSRYDTSKPLGSIQLYASPIWRRGFTYRDLNSSGYAHFQNVNIRVHLLSSNNQGAQ